MKGKRFVTLALTAVMAAAFALPNIATAAKKPLVVGTDPTGDWGQAVEPSLAPAGDAMGQDLVGASISMADKTTVNFIITLNSLPPSGGIPEGSRYTWDMNVDGNFLELDGKFTNYSRGACDPTSGQCPPPRDPGMQPFMVRTNCAANEANVTVCEEVGIVQATFDAATATITIPVSLELLNAKPGSKIQPGTNIFGGSISTNPSAFVSSSAAPLDTLTVIKTFKIPR